MSLIPENIIQQIKAYSLVQFIMLFVDLKRKNGNYVGVCPFHDEKSGSFDVSPAKGLYKCFGCDKTGHNPIDFILDLENLSFVDAVKRCMSLLDISSDHMSASNITTPMPKRIKK